MSKKPWQEIKEHLEKRGGLYITNRRVGKTTALLHILRENPEAVILTINERMARHLRNKYIHLFPDPLPGEELIRSLRGRIITATEYCPKNAKVYIDEYFFHNPKYLPKDFAGAVSTMKFPVTIKRFPQGDSPKKQIQREGEGSRPNFPRPPSAAARKIMLGDKQFRLEYTMEFG